MTTLHPLFIGLFCMMFLGAMTGRAQSLQRSVFSSGGNTIQSNNILLCISLGEAIAGPIIKDDQLIQQGFQQEKSIKVSLEPVRDNSGFIIYPNPANEEIRIHNPLRLRGAYAYLTSGLGQLLLVTQLEEGSTTIQTGDMPSGFYRITIYDIHHRFIDDETVILVK